MPERLRSSIIRRWVQLQDRVAFCEARLGPGSAMAEKAVRALIDFEEDAGPALAAAMAASPLRQARSRMKEEDFTNEI